MAMPGRDLKGDYRYQYQGQEVDDETGKPAFQLRLYDPRINRWISPDPYGQYHSPYMAMGNNWLNGVDPDGGCWDSEGNPCPDSNVGDTTVDGQGNSWTFTETGWNTTAYDDFSTTVTHYTDSYWQRTFSSENLPDFNLNEDLSITPVGPSLIGTGIVGATPIPKSILPHLPQSIVGPYGRNFIKGSPFTSVSSLVSRRLGLGGAFGRSFPSRMIAGGHLVMFAETIYNQAVFTTDKAVLEMYHNNNRNNPYRGFVFNGLLSIPLHDSRVQNTQTPQVQDNPYRGFVFD